ncbi:uncharacterized protein LOC111051870 isoform X1 [Nilaparvata lugens]|uniref:uncharacterized protein LOC111051870 isoform X1 n=1 Tax=Nilaparvata lugens TaxID=108931 RepID=UPI00193CD838|nr:uncharacterized protein LOC111051870 isoform X1 [Nilaparvata lugens]
MASSHLMKNSAILLIVFTFGICSAAIIEVEIDAMELGDGDYMSKRTGSKHSDSIVVGSFSPFLDPGAEYKAKHTMASDPVYNCVKQKKEDYDVHRQEFETKIRKRNGNVNSVLTNEETLAEVSVTDYFVYVAQEVWICTGNQMNENPTFYRVRNELFSIKDIREVYYGLGVSVSMIRHHLTIGNRSKIEEIKYFVQDASTKELTKTSKLLIKSYKIEKNNAVSIPNLSNEFVLSDVREKINGEGMAQVNVSSTGESFKIGSSWKKDAEYRQPPSQYIGCKKIQYWNPAPFRPEVYKIRNIPVTDQHRKVIAKFSDEEFEKMFTIVGRSIWNCEHYENGTEMITSGPAVYLVVHEIIGKIPIQSVSFFPRDLQNIYAVKLTGGGETVRYTDISFYYRSNWTRLEMDISSVYSKIETSAFVEIQYQRGNVTETRKEVHYLLDSGNVFSTFIDEVGYHLRVGTQAVETIVDENNVECEKVPYDDIFKNRCDDFNG